MDLPFISTCFVACQSYKEILWKGNRFEKRKAVTGFCNLMGAFRGKAKNRYEKDTTII